MNARIQELAEQCWVDRKYGPAWFNQEKFAELIIRDCAQALIDNTPVLDEYDSEEDWDKGYGQAMMDCVHHIKEHFGVEE